MREILGEEKKYSNGWFLGLYLKYGSVEEAIKRHEDNLPISVANYHRLVKKYGLIKSAGRHVSFPETLHFFREKAFTPGTPLERIYTQMPPSFQTSLSTLHRIYQYMEKAVVRRHAVALIATSGGGILAGREVFGNSRYGKKVGDLSIPMSFAKEDENHVDSALRVLQQEIYSDLATRGELRENSDFVQNILPRNLEPIFYFDIVDVRVKVFEVNVPGDIPFSSYKLTDHTFQNISSLLSQKAQVRAGVDEIVKLYEGYLHSPYTVKFPAHYLSAINSAAMAYESLPIQP